MKQSNSHKLFVESLVRSMGQPKRKINEADMSSAATMAPNAALPNGGMVGMKRTPQEQKLYDFQRIHAGMYQLYNVINSTAVGKSTPQIKSAWQAMNKAIEQAEMAVYKQQTP